MRAVLAAELTPELTAAAAGTTSVHAPPAIALTGQRTLHARGRVAPSWPVAWGGCDWPAARRWIFARETSNAGAPPLSPMGPGMCGPVLLDALAAALGSGADRADGVFARRHARDIARHSPARRA